MNVYEEIYNLTRWSDLTGAGQNIYYVAKGAIDFLDKYATEADDFGYFF